jgi:hypothetical protein
MINQVLDTTKKLHMLKQAPERSIRQVPHSQRMEIMLQFNHLHKAKKVSKQQSKEDIKKPSLHLKENSRHLQDGHQRKGMKMFFMVNVTHVMNIVTKIWNVDIMQGNIVKYFITP